MPNYIDPGSTTAYVGQYGSPMECLGHGCVCKIQETLWPSPLALGETGLFSKPPAGKVSLIEYTSN